MIRCLHCGAETSNGLALCDLCRRRADEALAWLPVYHRNLARWRSGVAGSRPVPGSRVLWSGEERATEPDRITRAVALAEVEVSGRVRQLVDDRGIDWPADDFAAWCATLADHLASIACLDWCGDLVRELAHHERRLRALTEGVIPGWYAGACRTLVSLEGDRCDTPTHVVPGLTWTTCPGCGRTTAARDHLEDVLDEARDWIAPPKRIAEAIVALVDTEDSVPRLHDRIRWWQAKGYIAGVRGRDEDGDEVGPRRYRLGDVLDLIQRDTRSLGATAAS